MPEEIIFPQGDRDSTLKLFLGAVLGFSFFSAASNNNSPINKRLPNKKIKNISLFPRIKIHYKKDYYHIHHWIILSAIYLPLFLKKTERKSNFLRGLFLGSIIQGLTFPDRFKIKYNSSEKN